VCCTCVCQPLEVAAGRRRAPLLQSRQVFRRRPRSLVASFLSARACPSPYAGKLTKAGTQVAIPAAETRPEAELELYTSSAEMPRSVDTHCSSRRCTTPRPRQPGPGDAHCRRKRENGRVVPSQPGEGGDMGWWPAHGRGPRGPCEASVAHSAAGPRPLLVGARRVELGHQLGQRLHGQPLLRSAHAGANTWRCERRRADCASRGTASVPSRRQRSPRVVQPANGHNRQGTQATHSGTPRKSLRRACNTCSAEQTSMLASAHAIRSTWRNGNDETGAGSTVRSCYRYLHQGVAIGQNGGQAYRGARQ
jgi:hypothetical protein